MQCHATQSRRDVESQILITSHVFFLNIKQIFNQNTPKVYDLYLLAISLVLIRLALSLVLPSQYRAHMRYICHNNVHTISVSYSSHYSSYTY